MFMSSADAREPCLKLYVKKIFDVFVNVVLLKIKHIGDNSMLINKICTALHTHLRWKVGFFVQCSTRYHLWCDHILIS